jgi:hypothetical protein
MKAEVVELPFARSSWFISLLRFGAGRNPASRIPLHEYGAQGMSGNAEPQLTAIERNGQVDGCQ